MSGNLSWSSATRVSLGTRAVNFSSTLRTHPVPAGRTMPVEVCLQRFLKELVIEEDGTVSLGAGKGICRPRAERPGRSRHGTFAPALKVYLVEMLRRATFLSHFLSPQRLPLRRRQVVGMGHHCRNRQQAPVGTVFKPDRGIGVCMVVSGGEGEGLPPVPRSSSQSLPRPCVLPSSDPRWTSFPTSWSSPPMAASLILSLSQAVCSNEFPFL
jgi:hypothetical protein